MSDYWTMHFIVYLSINQAIKKFADWLTQSIKRRFLKNKLYWQTELTMNVLIIQLSINQSINQSNKKDDIF